MAHYQQLEFVKTARQYYPAFFSNKSVLEIGSWDTNGSVRNMFDHCEYVGVDIAPGPGVDIVCEGQKLTLDDQVFDVVISCECFEHNPNWRATFSNMVRMLKKGGLCLVTCATLGRREHGTVRTNPTASLTALNSEIIDGNYYQNLRRADIESVFNLSEVFSEYYFFTNIYSRDLYFIGFKKAENETSKNLINPHFVKNVKAIKRVKQSNIITNTFKHIKFWCTYYYAMLIGEKKFHDQRL